LQQPSQKNKDIHFRSILRELLQSWQEEHQADPSLPAAEDLTKRLWGNADGWTPYMDLTMVNKITPGKIVDAIEMFVSEYHDSSAWDVMDAWIEKWSADSKPTHSDLWQIVEVFESVIYQQERPDLDY
jgi:hypothetical protein